MFVFTRRHFIFGVVGLLTAFIITALFWLSLQESQEQPDGLSGTIFLSLIPSDFHPPLGVYAFDVGNRDLEPVAVSFDGTRQYAGGDISPDGRQMALVSRDVADPAAFSQIHVRGLENGAMQQITSDDTYKQNPAWSPKGNAIAYMALAADTTDEAITETDAWDVYISGLDGATEHITHGVQPHFSPDGTSLIVLQSDGLHQVDVESGADTLVWPVDGEAYRGMKLGLSRDKSMLAWGSPTDGEIVVIRITSWTPFNGVVTSTIPTTAFWPRFSPDDRYLVAEEIEPGDEEYRHPKLVAYELETNERFELADLSDFYQEAMWVNAWGE